LVLVVVAAAAPMAAMVGNLPLALALGNGAGLPGAFALATVLLLVFAVGYGAMSRRVVNTGAFYTYVAAGLGRPPAVVAAWLAVGSYLLLVIGLVAGLGYFTALVIASFGPTVSWVPASAVAVLLIGVLGYRSVDVSVRVLAVLIAAEVVVLVVLDGAIAAREGLAALPSAALAPGEVLGPGLGIGLMFALTSFIGFESAALYGEEVADPAASVPRATYAAIGVSGGFYVLTSWLTVGALGVGDVRRVAEAARGDLLFDVARRFAAPAVADAMGLLLCTSVLASALAVHNVVSRYAFALGRERLLPAALGRSHPRTGAPARASLTVTAVTAVVVAAFASSGLDPYRSVAPSMIGLSTVGIVALQALAAVAIVGYFWRRPEPGLWRHRLAPGLGALGLGTTVLLLVANYPVLTGVDDPLLNRLPVLLGLLAVAALGWAWWLRRWRPAVYGALGAVGVRPPDRPDAAQADQPDAAHADATRATPSDQHPDRTGRADA
jgi:amino acid transporter